MAKKKYFLDATTFRKIKSLDFSEMNAWLKAFYEMAYQDGVDSVPGADIKDVLKAIGEIKGIGTKRMEAIKEALDRL